MGEKMRYKTVENGLKIGEMINKQPKMAKRF
jgi:hypothetical protein